ncbi:PIG-L deacetylase family protein [Arvimicrobium flavum]|uniref:PIG-L deacetylase family protein n=1 Tax=Arvimicrobium flavum TaxID=3393320 RepID=UPI00237B8CF1|nr:PIG-L deacetylase family protein [Mesorhizobium shangrilense]
MEKKLEMFGRTLVIAPHPDDEALGAGGVIARLSNAGHDVYVAIVTTGREPEFSRADVARVHGEAETAHAILGVRRTLWLDLPAAQLVDTPRQKLNAAVRETILNVRPDTVLLPYAGDVHIDHQLVFEAALVAVRPHQAEYPSTVLAYETLSETNWNAPYLTPSFQPNVYVDIRETLDRKIEAMKAYASQLRASPHERSVEALRALATLRGATVHRAAAEGFVLVRSVVNP